MSTWLVAVNQGIQNTNTTNSMTQAMSNTFFVEKRAQETDISNEKELALSKQSRETIVS